VQNVFALTHQTSLEEPANPSVKPVEEIEGALRDFVRRDIKNSSAKEAADLAANVDSLVQRPSSLGELQNVIQELEQLHDFLHSEGRRLELEISEYARLSKSTVSATRLITDTMLRKKTDANNP